MAPTGTEARAPSNGPRRGLLEVAQVTKRYGNTFALSGVSLSVFGGEIHAVLGRNGAGKSTLLRVISGAETASSGAVTLNGTVVSSVHKARQLGIGMIHQELTVVPTLTVAENIYAGMLPTKWGLVHRPTLANRAARLLEDMGASFGPNVMVADLSTPQRQLVEIAKALARSATLLVMDEPTSSLSSDGVEEVLRIVRAVARRGLGVMYVSHRLDEVLAVADNITVLRDGRVAGSGDASGFRANDIVDLMIGVGLPAPGRGLPPAAPEKGEAEHLGTALAADPRPVVPSVRNALEVEHLSAAGLVQDVSFALRPGEIVGLAGLVGSGRTELARAIAGLDPVTAGSVRVGDKPLRLGRPARAVRAGITYAPEERKSAGLFLDMTVAENVSIVCLGEMLRWGLLRPAREVAIGEGFVQRLGIRPSNARARVRTLSGGNQQKVVLAKQLASRATVLLLDEPTRGVDVAAKAEIYNLMREVAAEGKALLFISSEFEELIGLCDRVMVFRQGRVVSELSSRELSLASLMAAASTVEPEP